MGSPTKLNNPTSDFQSDSINKVGELFQKLRSWRDEREESHRQLSNIISVYNNSVIEGINDLQAKLSEVTNERNHLLATVHNLSGEIRQLSAKLLVQPISEVEEGHEPDTHEAHISDSEMVELVEEQDLGSIKNINELGNKDVSESNRDQKKKYPLNDHGDVNESTINIIGNYDAYCIKQDIVERKITHQVNKLKEEEPKSNGDQGGDKKITCEQCPYETSHKGTMKIHIEGKHKKIKRVTCETCGYATYHKGYLQKHIKSVHGNIRDHVCGECGYATSTRTILKNHILNMHNTGDKKYICDNCPYKAAVKANLRRHVDAKHKNIRDHICKDCGFAASLKESLKTHMVSIHNIGDKKLTCEKCPYTTAHKGHMKTHIQGTHDKVRNHVCKECGHTVFRKRDLERHMKSAHQVQV